MEQLDEVNNGIPEGLVLASTLFSLYVADIPQSISRKFGYADNLVIATNHKDLETTEDTDLRALSEYFMKRRLQPTKTEVSIFHLNNIEAENYEFIMKT